MAKNKSELERFEQCALPHLDAAHNLARWLVGNNSDAQDIVQEAYLRALKYFDSFHGTDARGWLLTIVRNTSYTWLRENRMGELTVSLDEDGIDAANFAFDTLSDASGVSVSATNPEAALIQQLDEDLLRRAIAMLPVEFREVMVLRELEELSYKQIASIAAVPVGTVMSRLARARKRLQVLLAPGAPVLLRKETTHEL